MRKGFGTENGKKRGEGGGGGTHYSRKKKEEGKIDGVEGGGRGRKVDPSM